MRLPRNVPHANRAIAAVEEVRRMAAAVAPMAVEAPASDRNYIRHKYAKHEVIHANVPHVAVVCDGSMGQW